MIFIGEISSFKSSENTLKIEVLTPGKEMQKNEDTCIRTTTFVGKKILNEQILDMSNQYTIYCLL